MELKRYHVTYYYLATGMEGRADRRDYGHAYAVSEDQAKESIAWGEYPRKIVFGIDTNDFNRSFFKGGLTAKEVK